MRRVRSGRVCPGIGHDGAIIARLRLGQVVLRRYCASRSETKGATGEDPRTWVRWSSQQDTPFRRQAPARRGKTAGPVCLPSNEHGMTNQLEQGAGSAGGPADPRPPSVAADEDVCSHAANGPAKERPDSQVGAFLGMPPMCHRSGLCLPASWRRRWDALQPLRSPALPGTARQGRCAPPVQGSLRDPEPMIWVLQDLGVVPMAHRRATRWYYKGCE